jgi:hypothetical protein
MPQIINNCCLFFFSSGCPNGKYGIECFERCPFCLNRGPCHPETGVCERGCAPGYMGKSCDMGKEKTLHIIELCFD